MNTSTPMKVTFHLSSPMSDPAHPIHLDGLLAWAYVESLTDDSQCKTIDDARRALPLDKFDTHDHYPIWKASILECGLRGGMIGAETKRMLLRKTDVEQMSVLKEKGMFSDRKSSGFDANPFSGDQLNGSSGWARNFQEFYPIKDYATATAYCVGNMDAVKLLLDKIKWVGKRGVRGHGKVVRVDVIEDESAHTLCLKRALPLDFFVENMPSNYYRALTTVCNPYWDSSLRVHGWLPNKSVDWQPKIAA